MLVNIQPDEIELTGDLIVVGGRVVGDATCERIKQLIASQLILVARDASGWDTLYRDPRDERLWELTYPKSEMHGGGPPRLSLVTPEQASATYLT